MNPSQGEFLIKVKHGGSWSDGVPWTHPQTALERLAFLIADVDSQPGSDAECASLTHTPARIVLQARRSKPAQTPYPYAEQPPQWTYRVTVDGRSDAEVRPVVRQQNGGLGYGRSVSRLLSFESAASHWLGCVTDWMDRHLAQPGVHHQPVNLPPFAVVMCAEDRHPVPHSQLWWPEWSTEGLPAEFRSLLTNPPPSLRKKTPAPPVVAHVAKPAVLLTHDEAHLRVLLAARRLYAASVANGNALDSAEIISAVIGVADSVAHLDSIERECGAQ